MFVTRRCRLMIVRIGDACTRDFLFHKRTCVRTNITTATKQRKHQQQLRTSKMKITFLGTSSGVPTAERNMSNIDLMLENGSVYMFDCGEGTQHQMQKSILKSGKVTTIFITHLHGDHVFGLPGLLCSLSGNNPPTRTRMDIYGPLGLAQFLRTSLRMSDSHLGFTLAIHELVPVEMKDKVTETSQSELLQYEEATSYIHFDDAAQCFHVVKKDSVTIRAAPINHRVYTVGYVIEEDSKPGQLDMQKVAELKVPKGPMLGKLKNGIDITLDDGTVVKASDVVGPEQRGKKVVILGDTHDPSSIATIAQDCDAITHESTLSNAQRDLAIDRGHSCPAMAAAFAVQIKAKNLILTHFSARFLQEGVVNDKMDSLDLLKKEAAEIYTEKHGGLFLANDFRTFTVNKNYSITQEQHEPQKTEDTVASD
jgi:ribonuclease Z